MKDDVRHPSHYASKFAVRPIECQTIRQYLPPNISDAFKYIWRAGQKDNADKDLNKALMYLEFADHHISQVGRPAEETPVGRVLWSLLERPEKNDKVESLRFKILERLVYGAVFGLDEMIDELRLLLTGSGGEKTATSKGVTEGGVVVEGEYIRLGDVDYIHYKHETLGDTYVAVEKIL